MCFVLVDFVVDAVDDTTKGSESEEGANPATEVSARLGCCGDSRQRRLGLNDRTGRKDGWSNWGVGRCPDCRGGGDLGRCDRGTVKSRDQPDSTFVIYIAG